MAFLSYSHDDAEVADWLHEELEEFHVPSRLVGRLTDQGPVPKRLSPVFRDRHELAASSDLGEEIEEAITGSRFLIVLCSPDAAKSRWIDQEIATFKRHHGEDRILALIVDGEPFASDMPGREEEECFPPSLRVHFDRRGRPTTQRAEPIAADLRDEGDGKRMGLLKIAAGMIGVGLDELAQREAQRRHRRLYLITAASVAGMLFTSALAYTAIDARDEARDQRREAEGLIGFMLGDLRQKLEPLGRLDVLDSVGTRALAYYESQDKSQLSDESLAQRSRALTLMGEMAHARGDLDGALRRYREAMASTGELARRAPDNPENLFNHAQNVFWVGWVARDRGMLEQTEAFMREYKRLAERMIVLDPKNEKWQLELKYANTNLGIVLVDLRRYGEAVAVFQSSLAEAERLAASAPENADYLKTRIETLAWLSEALEKDSRIDEGLAKREEQLALLDTLIRNPDSDAEYRRQAMVAHRAAGRLFTMKGNLRGGLEHLNAAIRIGEELRRIDPDNADWAGLAAFPYLERGELELAAGKLDEANASARVGCDMANRLVQRDASVDNWRVNLRGACLRLRLRLAITQGATDEALALANTGVANARAELVRDSSAEMRMFVAQAEMMRGMAALAAKDSAAASTAFRSAGAAWPKDIALTPDRTAQQVLIFEGLHWTNKANAGAAKLAAIGYRHPNYVRDRRTIKRGGG